MSEKLTMIRSLIAGFAFAISTSIGFAQTFDQLSIESGEAKHAFTVELASTPEEIERGLMEREALAADAGMLFDFGETGQQTMWMKNTPLSLDMLFLDSTGQVLAIARNAAPQSERRIQVASSVRAVLEINAGKARELGIEPGAQVRHAMFDNLREAPASE